MKKSKRLLKRLLKGQCYEMKLLFPRSSLLTISKSFVKPNLDYGDVVCDQPNNSRLSDKIETVQ